MFDMLLHDHASSRTEKLLPARLPHSVQEKTAPRFPSATYSSKGGSLSLDQGCNPNMASRKLDDSFEPCVDRGSQPAVHAASKTGVAAQEKAAPFFLALYAGAALDDGP
jgi:hypothetical protein